MICKVNVKKLHDSEGDVNLGKDPRQAGYSAARRPPPMPFVGFILDNHFGNEYCLYSNGPGRESTRHRGVAVGPRDKKK